MYLINLDYHKTIRNFHKNQPVILYDFLQMFSITKPGELCIEKLSSINNFHLIIETERQTNRQDIQTD